MTDELYGIDPVDEIDLRHYASKYYDPVKAREYYLKTRELKGRSDGQAISKESRQRQSEAKSYVRDQIRTQKQAEEETAATQYAERLEKMKAAAEELQAKIVAKLTEFVDKIKADLEKEAPKPTLNKIPATASPRQRAFLEKQNQRLMDAYNSKVNKAQAKVNDAISESKKEIREVGVALREAVSTVRTEYTTARKAMREKYSADLKTELQNIEDQVR